MAAGLVLARAVTDARERLPWALLGAGMLLHVSSSWLDRLDPQPHTALFELAGVAWLAMYPAAYAGIVLLARSRLPNLGVGTLLDGTICGLTAAAALTALTARPVLEALGQQGSSEPAAADLLLAAGDALLLSTLLGIWLLPLRPRTPAWGLLAGGFALMLPADVSWVVQNTLPGSDFYSPVNALWPLGKLALAAAAWTPAVTLRDQLPVATGRDVGVPLTAGAVALALGLASQLVEFSPTALAVAYMALLVVLLRLAVSLHENSRSTRTRLRRSERRLQHAEMELRLADLRRQAIVDGAADGIWEWRENEPQPTWNVQMRRMVGVPDDHPLTVEFFRDELIHPDDLPLWQREHTARELDSMRLRLRHQQTGAYLTCAVRWTRHAAPGEPKSIVGIVTDLSSKMAARSDRLALARDLHDSVLQELATARTYVHTARQLDPAQADAVLDTLEEELQAAERDLRFTVETLRATADSDGAPPLETLLRSVTDEFRRRAPHVELRVKAAPAATRLPVAPAALRASTLIVREALTNVHKHAHARQVTVAVSVDSGCSTLRIEVCDDGIGTGGNRDATDGGLGVAGMRERAQDVGAHLRVYAPDTGGTIVELTIPRAFLAEAAPSAASAAA